MLAKGNKIKTIVIFFIFIFLGALIFSGLKILEYKNSIKDNEAEIVSIVDKEIENQSENIFLKFNSYRSEDFIKHKDFTEEINSRKDSDKKEVESNIEDFKNTAKVDKERIEKNEEGLSKEKIAEEIKAVEKLEKRLTEEAMSKLKKSDKDYREELLQEQLKSKNYLEKTIKNSVINFKYLIMDNKSGDYDTNSSYGKDDIEDKFFNDSKYAVKITSENKSAASIKEYINGKSVNSSDYRLVSPRHEIMETNNILYIWVPSKGLVHGDVRDLITSIESSYSLKNTYIYISAISGVLLFVSIILLWKLRKKVDVNYNFYDKIPADILIILLSILSILYVFKSGLFFVYGMFWGDRYNFYFLNSTVLILGTGVLGTILVTYIKYMNKKSIRDVLKNGILTKGIIKLKGLFEVRDMVLKMGVIFVIISLQVLLVGNSYFLFKKLWIIVPIIFLIVDGVLFFFLTKKLIYFNDILEGTEKITSGDLTLVLEEKGKGNLGKLSHNINNMKIGLKNSLEKEMKSERMKSELITNVSHDLKTPLTSIINYVDLLKKEKLTPDKANDYVEILDRKSKRLKTLVEDLFEASKAASGSMELNIENIEITELIKQTLAEFEEKILSSTLDFRVNLGKEKVYAMVDGKRTYRVFENLVQNVLKYSMKHSRVYIDLIQEEGTIKFTIKNMSSYEMNFNAEEIAERFKRGDVARTTEGSGLGLAIAKSIMELQGGELKLQVDGDLFKAVVIFKE